MDNNKIFWYFKKTVSGVTLSYSDIELDFVRKNLPLSLALPREAQQNTKDQQIGDEIPVISFKVVKLSQKEGKTFKEKFLNKLNYHVTNKKVKKRLVEIPENFDFNRFLVIEDFNTSGLTGEYKNFDKMEKEEGNFYSFMWIVGESGKGGTKGGRRGLGRNVFAFASYFRSFFVLTKRYDDKKKFLMGFSNLGSHEDESGKKLYPFGHFGTFSNPESKDLIQPVEDEVYIETFSKLFKLDRGDKSGLSIISPFIHQLDQENIEKRIIEDSYIPILLERIIVKVENKTFDKNTILNHLSKDDLSFWEFIKNTKKEEMCFSVNFSITGIRDKKLGEESFNKEEFKKIRKMYDENKILIFKIPVKLFHKDKKEINTFFKVSIKKREKASLQGRFVIIRNVMSLFSSAKRNLTDGDPQDNYIFIDFDEPEISEFIGDAEDANHTYINRDHIMVERNYKNARNIISSINSTVKNLLNMFSDEEDDDADIKSLATFAQLNMSEFKEYEKKNNEGGGNTEDDIIVKPRRQSAFDIDKISNGAIIKGLDPITNIKKENWPIDIEIKCAYASLRGNPFKNPVDQDIDIKKLKKTINKSLKIKSMENNTIIISVRDKNFLLSISGISEDLTWSVNFCDSRLETQIPYIERNDE